MLWGIARFLQLFSSSCQDVGKAMCIEVNASDAVKYGPVFFGSTLSTRLCGKLVVFPQDCELASSQGWRIRLPLMNIA